MTVDAVTTVLVALLLAAVLLVGYKLGYAAGGDDLVRRVCQEPAGDLFSVCDEVGVGE